MVQEIPITRILITIARYNAPSKGSKWHHSKAYEYVFSMPEYMCTCIAEHQLYLLLYSFSVKVLVTLD